MASECEAAAGAHGELRHHRTLTRLLRVSLCNSRTRFPSRPAAHRPTDAHGHAYMCMHMDVDTARVACGSPCLSDPRSRLTRLSGISENGEPEGRVHVVDPAHAGGSTIVVSASAVGLRGAELEIPVSTDAQTDGVLAAAKAQLRSPISLE